LPGDGSEIYHVLALACGKEQEQVKIHLLYPRGVCQLGIKRIKWHNLYF
jgi:hypothetical protein